MKIDFRKIDFRQGKYWFPLVLFVPIVAIAYFSCQMFTGKATDTGVVTDSINTTMPEPEGYGLHNKYAEMEDNLVRGDGYTAINELGSSVGMAIRPSTNLGKVKARMRRTTSIRRVRWTG